MERTIIPPEFKGGIWHRFFSTASKKDETLVSILDEKMRYYKLYYPFLEKKQIVGKVYEELGIPHICGELNRKELYKLFMKERKNQCKLKEKYKKYPSLFIENKSRNKGMVKKPMIQTTKQIKVNSVHTNIEKSKEDLDFDNLISNVYPKKKEGMIQNMNLKQPKSVRFNDGIEVHSVSPSQPLYKLKPLGRLFDEPSAVRSVETVSHSQQELQERIEDSDSDFDADTGITSDGEDYELEEPPHIEDCNEKSETTLNEKVEEKSIINSKTKTIYDCVEEDSQSTDHEISKEGNDLILSSKMMTVVQGKWVRETKQIIGNIYHNNDTITSNRKSMNEDGVNETPEFTLVRSIEQILESIKSLCISNAEEHNTSSETISLREREESELNMGIEKEQLLVGNIKVGHDHTDIEISIQDKNKLKQRQKVSKNINSQISLENDLSRYVIDEKLLTIDNNKLSYEHDIFEMKNNMERNLEKRIRTKPIKLVNDLIDYIHDWSSSNSSSNHNASRTSSTKPMLQSEDQEGDKYKEKKVIKKMKSMVDKESSSEHSLIEDQRCSEKEKNKLADLSLEEEGHSDKEDDLKELSNEEKHCLNEQSSQILSINDDQKVSLVSKQFESNKFHNKMSQSPIIKTEPPSSSNKLRIKKVDKREYEAHDSLPNINLPYSKITEVSEEKELQIDDTLAYIRSMMCNQSTSNPNELYSTFCSLITKPILIQTPYEESKDDDKGNYSKSLETEELKQVKKKIKSGYSVSEHSPSSEYRIDTKTYGVTKRDNEIKDDGNMSYSHENSEYNSKVMVQPKIMKNSVITKISMDNSNCFLAGHETEKESEDNTTKISVTDKQLFCGSSEDILDDIKKTEMVEDHTAVRSYETNSTNFLSKVRMWSSHFQKYSGDSTMVSQSSSVLASCNTDSFRKEVVDMEDSTIATDDQNNQSHYSNLSNEDSLTSKSNEEDDISDEWNDTGMNLETASSTKTVTPVKVERNSEEVSTAYETDPETGKLVSNRFLRQITSTPIKLEQEDSDPRRSIENSLEESSTHSFHFIKENKGNQSIKCETNNTQNLSISVIDETTIKSDSQYRNENVQSDLSSHTSLLINNERNQTETCEVISSSGKDEETSKLEKNKNSELNDFTQFSIEKHGEVPSGTDKPVLQRVNSNKFSCESIIENNETDSHRIFKKEKNSEVVKTITSHTISIVNQEGQLARTETDINPTEIDITFNIKNLSDFSVSETPGSCSEQQRNPNEATYESSTRSNEHNTSKNKATLNLKRIDKTSADSHSTDIIYDTSSLTEDQKIGHYTKTCTVGQASAVEGESNLLTSENLINENEQNVADDLIITQRLSAVSETIFNNGSKIDDTEKKSFLNSSHNDFKNEDETNDVGLGMHQTLLKKKIKNRQASVSHVTFLIRNPQSPEGKALHHTESVNQPLANLTQSHNVPKIKLHAHNKEPDTDEIQQTAPKVHTGDDKNESRMTEHSNNLALDNNGSHFSIGVQNSHIEPPIMYRNNEEHKYFTRSRTYLSLKRKLGTINENDSGSDISLSQDESTRKEIKINVSSNIHSKVVRYSESPVTTESSSIEMNLKRVNTDIRRKRAKLKKQNPVRKSSTSSSDDEVIKPSLLKGKSLESSKLPVHEFTESNINIKHKFNLEDKVESIDTRAQKKSGRGQSDPKDGGVSRSLSTSALSFENKARSDTALKILKESEYNKLSDSSSSIIYSSPNLKTGLQGKPATYDESKTQFVKRKKGPVEEESQYLLGNINSTKNMSKKSHKSYSLYRKHDGSNKENSNIPFKEARTINEYSKKPLKQSNPGKSDAILGDRKDENSETKNPHQNIKKNRKSSVVRLMGTSEASQISHSPEVKGLLRRTYFMGNN